MKTLIITLTLFLILQPAFAEEEVEAERLQEMQKACLAITDSKLCADEGYCVWTTVPAKKCSLNKSKAKSMLQDENEDKKPKKKSK